MSQPAVIEYIWIDGYETKNLRSKIKVVDLDLNAYKLSRSSLAISSIPEWSFDGSSTNQADGNNSDCILSPVYTCPNPMASVVDHLVLCEVYLPDGQAHHSNTRCNMMEIFNYYKNHEMWFAFEQEYTLYNERGTWPYKWPKESYPPGQGRYYCGIGADVAWGRRVSEDHLQYSLNAGLPLCGTNAEVMASQWEYQIGPRTADTIADEFWMSRFLLNRIAEGYGATVKLDPKPIEGDDWNGAGCHVNFSTIEMRESLCDDLIDVIAKKLQKSHEKHLDVYGKDNDKRLTGKHETCSIEEFRIGHGDRKASIRIPPIVKAEGKGYLEDRRPAANIDPYEVCAIMMETVCDSIRNLHIKNKISN